MPARLRPLETAPFERGADDYVALLDPLHVAPVEGPASALLDRRAWAIARRCDGCASAEEIARAASAELGAAVEAAEVERTVADLSRRLLLDDARANEAIAGELASFRALDVRPAAGAGVEYPGDPIDLRIRLAGMVADHWDMPPPPDVSGAWTSAGPLAAAGALHGRTFAALRHFAGRFARVLVLAALRAPFPGWLVPYDKPFATPFGAVDVDRAALALLPRCAGPELLAHRGELDVERQALFLRLLWPGVPIVPVLVAGAEPSGRSAALAALRAVLDLPGRTLLLAAADLSRSMAAGIEGFAAEAGRAPLAHRGEHRAAYAGAGSAWLVTGSRAERTRTTDSLAIDALTRLDAAGLDAAVRGDGHPFRVSTLPLLALTADLLAGRASPVDGTAVRGSLLGYLQFPARGARVGAASVLFH